MEKVLVVVDMQNDFIDGELGSQEAQAIVPKVVEKIKNWDDHIIATYDTHFTEDCREIEAQRLPKHCICDSEGYELNSDVDSALNDKDVLRINKYTFAPSRIVADINHVCTKSSVNKIEIVGLCTDICVISIALRLRSAFPLAEIIVDASCCAGVTPELHEKALDVMESCLIDIVNRK